MLILLFCCNYVCIMLHLLFVELPAPGPDIIIIESVEHGIVTFSRKRATAVENSLFLHAYYNITCYPDDAGVSYNEQLRLTKQFVHIDIDSETMMTCRIFLAIDNTLDQSVTYTVDNITSCAGVFYIW